MKTPRAHIDRSLDLLDLWMMEQRDRVARRLHESDAKLADGRNDGMERYHIRTETDITRRQQS